jgi:hypothetical protein
VLVIDDGKTRFAIAACDLLAINEYTAARVREQVEFPVIFCCSHTHSGPIVYAEDNSRRKNRGYIDTLVERLVVAVRQAADKVQPVNLYWGTGEADIAVNRRERKPDGSVEIGQNLDGVVDKTLNILQARKHNGEPLITMINYSCHPTVLGPKNLLVSADWPGVMRRKVEAEIGAQCVFIQGATADLNPKHEWGDDDFEAVERLGSEVATQVFTALKNLHSLVGHPVRYAENQVWLPIDAKATSPTPPKTYKNALSGMTRVPRLLVDTLLNARFPWRSTIKSKGGVWRTPMVVQSCRIGEFGMLSFGMEVFTEIGMAAKELIPTPYAFFSSVTSGSVGYLPTSTEHRLGGYEVDISPYLYRLPGKLESTCDRLSLDTAEEMVVELWEG